MKNNIIVMIIVVVIVGVGAFFGGIQYQKSQQPTMQFGERGQFTRGGGQAGGNTMFRQRTGGPAGQNVQAVRGEITSSDSGSITVKMQDGSSKLVSISSSTKFTKSDTGSKTDLKKGEQVMVFGSNNSDGSVNAQMVQLNPMMMRFGTGDPNGGGNPPPTQ